MARNVKSPANLSGARGLQCHGNFASELGDQRAECFDLCREIGQRLLTQIAFYFCPQLAFGVVRTPA